MDNQKKFTGKLFTSNPAGLKNTINHWNRKGLWSAHSLSLTF